jgi:hypothetical protein
MAISSRESILNSISKYRKVIYDRISEEDIDVYVFLMERFQSSKRHISNDHLFQFIYRSYYRLDNAGLTNEFKTEYFKIMEGLSDCIEIDLRAICNRLKQFKNIRKQVSLQFSFCTKLIATINPEYPIYDSFVAEVFNFSLPSKTRLYEEKLDEYMKFYIYLSEVTRFLLRNESIIELCKLLTKKLSKWEEISDNKKIDFIIWTVGKIIGNK